MTNPLCCVAKLTQRTVDRFDGRKLIKLRGLFFTVAGGKIFGSKIVGDADVHALLIDNPTAPGFVGGSPIVRKIITRPRSNPRPSRGLTV